MIFGAGGSLAPPIFIVADDDMPEGDIDVHKVNGLGIGVEPNPVGYLVFCKSHTLCHKFYEWMLENVVMPYVTKVKSDKGLDGDATTWFTLDGESKQITPMMSSDSQNLLNDNSIVVTKPPGSTSHVTQPADVGNVFKAIKATLSALKDRDLSDGELKDSVIHSIKCHEDKVIKKMTPSYRHKVCDGLLKIHRAMNKVMNPDIIRESFIETSMYNPVSCSYDLTKIMSKHKVTMSLDETLHFVESIPKLAKIIGERGELTEAALTRAGFPETTVKDNKTLIQQRTIFLTNRNIVQAEIKKKEAKDEAKAQSSKKVPKKRKMVSPRSSLPRKSSSLLKSYTISSDEDNNSSDSDFEY
jgi:hypothetical protein